MSNELEDVVKNNHKTVDQIILLMDELINKLKELKKFIYNG